MTKMIVGGLAAGGVGVAACAAPAGSWLLGVAPAHADTTTHTGTAAFLRHVHALGFQGGTSGDSDLVYVGMVGAKPSRTVCR
jgi:hypothetical protein